jgi:hypothetical protein
MGELMRENRASFRRKLSPRLLVAILVDIAAVLILVWLLFV